jgi:hypothetical protein
MADDLALLAHGQVRLVVAPQLGAAQAVTTVIAVARARSRALGGLEVEVVGLGAALVDEVLAQREVAGFTGGAV